MADRRRRRRRQRRQRDEGRAVAAALEVPAGELRVGAHPIQAFDVAAEESGGVVGGSLRAVASRARLGADVPAGLREMADHSAVPVYWERMAVCWQLAADHGLAISVLMRAAQRDIVDRQRFADRVEAGSAGACATAAILAGMPMIGVLLGQSSSARIRCDSFSAPVRGLDSGSRGGPDRPGVTWSDRIIDQGRDDGGRDGCAAAVIGAAPQHQSGPGSQTGRCPQADPSEPPQARQADRPACDRVDLGRARGLLVRRAGSLGRSCRDRAGCRHRRCAPCCSGPPTCWLWGLTRIRPGPCRTVMLPA